jgi:hypothetical protein
VALMLCVAVAGTAVEARADCHFVRGSIAETRIESNDPFGRLLGTVTGVLNGASTVDDEIAEPAFVLVPPQAPAFRSGYEYAVPAGASESNPRPRFSELTLAWGVHLVQ